MLLLEFTDRQAEFLEASSSSGRSHDDVDSLTQPTPCLAIDNCATIAARRLLFEA
jgi:hypothetical protein